MKIALMLVVASSLAACAVSNDELRAKLDNRAQLDLSCSNVQLAPEAAPAAGEGTAVTAYDVAGCGHRANYVYNPTTHNWIMTNADGHPVAVGSQEASILPEP
jgi:hypothetical protein